MTSNPRNAQRTCIVTRQVKPAGELLRFVRGPDNRLVFDLKGKLPGRGVWVTATRGHLERALEKGLFARAFKGEVIVPPDLLQGVESQLREAALGALGLARKAGLVITGHQAVEAAVRAGKVLALIHASDGAADGKRKLAQAAHSLEPQARPVATVIIFTSDQLSLALGRSNVVHAAAMLGHASKLFADRALTAASFGAEGADELTGARAGKAERSFA